jgi:hypothetical protein
MLSQCASPTVKSKLALLFSMMTNRYYGKKMTTGFKKMECPQEPTFQFLKTPAGF